MLGYARIVTIVMICFVYANHVSRETAHLAILWVQHFFIYIVNHILLVKVNGGKKLVFYTLLANGIVTALLGFLFPETCLYLIIFGIDAVGLFIHEFRRSMMYFLLLFLSLLVYKYITCVSTYR